MALTEDAAAKIILIRSIEECDRKFFSDSLLVDAFAAARSMAPGLGWVKARAQFLFDHLSPTYQSVIHLATLPTPLTLPVCLIALVWALQRICLGRRRKSMSCATRCCCSWRGTYLSIWCFSWCSWPSREKNTQRLRHLPTLPAPNRRQTTRKAQHRKLRSIFPGWRSFSCRGFGIFFTGSPWMWAKKRNWQTSSADLESTGTLLPRPWWLRDGRSCSIWGRCFWPPVQWRACISRDCFKVIKRSGAALSLRAKRPSSGLSIFSLVQVSWYPRCSVLDWLARSMSPACFHRRVTKRPRGFIYSRLRCCSSS